MWEKAEETQSNGQKKEMYPAPIAQVRRAARTQDALVLVQVVLCVALLLTVFALRALNAPFMPAISKEYEALLSQGIRFDEESQLVRFASGGVEGVQKKANAWLDELNGRIVAQQLLGKGAGITTKFKAKPKAKPQIPSGASTADYSIPETLLLPVEGQLTSHYGFRDNPFESNQEEDEFHLGIDIAAPYGTPVMSALDGQVCLVARGDSRGNYVVIRHRGGLKTLYQHMSYSFVRVGETVTQGQSIGEVGDTGNVTGAHLHLELIVDGLRVEPLVQFPTLSAS